MSEFNIKIWYPEKKQGMPYRPYYQLSKDGSPLTQEIVITDRVFLGAIKHGELMYFNPNWR